MKRLLIITPSLGKGGAEKNILFYYNTLKSNFDIRILVIKGNSKTETDPKIYYLQKSTFRKSLIRIMSEINRFNPDILFSSSYHLNFFSGIIKTIKPRLKTIIRESNTPGPRKKFTTTTKIPTIIYNYFINKNDVIIALGQITKKAIIKSYKADNEKIEIIKNPITKTNFIKSHQAKTIYRFITVASLSEKKGHKRLLQFLSKSKINFKYSILGEGKLKNELIVLSKELEINDKVEFLGQKDNILKYLITSDFYLFGSYVEGLSNSILESLSIGLPVIGYKSPGEHLKFIKNYQNGFLATNEDELLRKLPKVLDYTWNFDSIKKNALRSFSEKIIRKKILKTFNQL